MAAAALWLGSAACSTSNPTRSGAGALVVLLPRDALELDPRFVSDAYGHKISRLIFASLVTIDPQTLEAVPDLAERVEVVTPVHYRVTLRPNLRFSDGSTLDAADVLATYASVVDPTLATRYASAYARVARVAAPDPHTVDFYLDGPHATFMTDLELPIVRQEDAHRHMAAFGGQPPIGAGPYQLFGHEKGTIGLRANPHWYGGKPRFSELRMLVIRDDNTRALRLLAGAADLALNALPFGLLPLFEQHRGFTLRTAPGIGTTYIGVNTLAGPLADVRVRRAIAYAIDRRALIKAKLAGHASLARSFVPPGHWAFADDTASYDYDPQRARALLADAGFSGRAGGGSLHLTLRCGNDRLRHSVARAIAAMLHDVGVEIEVRPTEMATLIAELDRGHFELTTLQVPEVIEPHVLRWFFGSEHIPGKSQGGANRWRFSNAALDAAFERGRQSTDRGERRAAYAEVQHLLAEQVPVIPLWHEDVVAVGSPRSAGFVVPRDGRFSTLAR